MIYNFNLRCTPKTRWLQALGDPGAAEAAQEAEAQAAAELAAGGWGVPGTWEGGPFPQFRPQVREGGLPYSSRTLYI
jgi:hypothetical protein